MKTKFISMVLILAASFVAGFAAQTAPVTDGVAVAIVFDTSGSMNDPVKSSKGGARPKIAIGREALAAVLRQLDAYIQQAAPGLTRRVDIALLAFDNGSVRTVSGMRPFTSKDLNGLVTAVPSAGGGTPLGDSMSEATKAVLKSPLSRKHVLLITDGENTSGSRPDKVLPQLQRSLADKQAVVGFHVVAFDTDSRIFAPLKNLGVGIYGAGDEAQLNAQLSLILGKKILLEDEDVPSPSAAVKTK
jgi:uncharacterized protein YegL